MDPENNKRANGQGSQDIVIVTSGELQRLRIPLSVLHGYVQLLQRRLRQGYALDHDELIQTLGVMEEASRAIQTQLDVLSINADLRQGKPDKDN